MSSTFNSQHRINIKELEPECWKLIIEIEQFLARTSLDKQLRELIKIRTSQINKCAFCIDLHTKDALKLGETERRIFALSAWQESPLFSEKERAVLQLTEEITKINEAGLSDHTYGKISTLFSGNEIAQLIIAINHMNFLNRVAVSTKLIHPN